MSHDQFESSFRRNPEVSLPDPPPEQLMLTVRVDLVDADPPIWRRLEVRGELPLPAIHDLLQAAFGWQDSHLHRFDAPGASRNGPYFITEFDADEGDSGTPEAEVRLDQVLRAAGDTLRYTYDFGDRWEHRLTLESLRKAAAGDDDARCVAGERACPPENGGGIRRWNELTAALRADPDPAQLTGDLHAMHELLISLDPGHGTPLPTPGPELTALLGRCSVEAAQQLADIAARAVGFADEDIPQDDLDTTLRPWHLLLDAVGDDGIRLTSAGWLPPAVVVRLREELGFDRTYGKGNREEFTHEVKNLRESGARAGLIRTTKGRLVLTKLGRRCRDSQEELLRTIAQSLVPDKHEFDQDARVVTMLFVAADWKIGPDSRRAADAAARRAQLTPRQMLRSFEDDVAHMLHDIGWQLEGRRPLNSDDVRPPVIRVLNRLGAGHGKEFEVPSSPAIRKLARLALFEQ